MKYLNKKKKYRDAEWTAVPPPDNSYVSMAKRWCQQNPSKGYFYFHYTNTRWWFSDKNDALVFSLRWSHYGQK